jgi:hypothetical protein
MSMRFTVLLCLVELSTNLGYLFLVLLVMYDGHLVEFMQSLVLEGDY